MESLDNLRESMDNSITEKQEKSEKIPINGEFDIKPDENSKSKDIQDLIDIKSDNESGFDESSSQLSKSGHGDLTTTQTGIETGSLDSSMCSVGRDQLSLDLLVFEMNSVAIDWKSFRNVHNCSCASPFNSFTKKARHLYTCTTSNHL